MSGGWEGDFFLPAPRRDRKNYLVPSWGRLNGKERGKKKLQVSKGSTTIQQWVRGGIRNIMILQICKSFLFFFLPTDELQGQSRCGRSVHPSTLFLVASIHDSEYRFSNTARQYRNKPHRDRMRSAYYCYTPSHLTPLPVLTAHATFEYIKIFTLTSTKTSQHRQVDVTDPSTNGEGCHGTVDEM